jgi:hypothetical protein
MNLNYILRSYFILTELTVGMSKNQINARTNKTTSQILHVSYNQCNDPQDLIGKLQTNGNTFTVRYSSLGVARGEDNEEM